MRKKIQLKEKHLKQRSEAAYNTVYCKTIKNYCLLLVVFSNTNKNLQKFSTEIYANIGNR